MIIGDTCPKARPLNCCQHLRGIGHPGLITHPPPFRCQIDSRFDTGQGIEQLFDP